MGGDKAEIKLELRFERDILSKNPCTFFFVLSFREATVKKISRWG